MLPMSLPSTMIGTPPSGGVAPLSFNRRRFAPPCSMASWNAFVGRRNATAEYDLSFATSVLPNCVPSSRCSMTRFPPESWIAMATFQLFFFASASAPAMTFLACSRVIGEPYGGGGACWAPAEATARSRTVTTRKESGFFIEAPPRIAIRAPAFYSAPVGLSSRPRVRERRRLAAQSREHDVAEGDDLLLRRRERQERHEVEVAHAELGHLEDPARDIRRCSDESIRIAELGHDLVGNERCCLDRRLPVGSVREVGIDLVDGVGNLERRELEPGRPEPVAAPA